ncbi:hypothetical protein [Cellulomonas sp. P24]|uniref:hypothetical protein n=1 Tax=Cellulomonas sp. P24 TaxID=2885206 RepID=UPI00216AEDB1|nr:hypothetical protein [Cellulomonas sp. P24]MCR6494240.1 hypothetical protein [Cellulomonas sp. P24]
MTTTPLDKTGQLDAAQLTDAARHLAAQLAAGTDPAAALATAARNNGTAAVEVARAAATMLRAAADAADLPTTPSTRAGRALFAKTHTTGGTK